MTKPEEDKSCETEPQVTSTPIMSAEERVQYLSPDMIYDERELEFFRIRDEVNTRTLAELSESLARGKESLARGRESLARGRELIARNKELIEKLKAEQNNKTNE